MFGHRRFLSLAVLLGCAFLVSGLSNLGGDVPRWIPIPEKNFRATVVDVADVHTTLTMFSINGYTLFMGRKGKGWVTVPFAIIKRADLRLKGDILEAFLELSDGQRFRLTADRRQDCFGQTGFGNFKIKLGDVKKFTIDELIFPENKKK